jgi:hypothetical protein
VQKIIFWFFFGRMDGNLVFFGITGQSFNWKKLKKAQVEELFVSNFDMSI